MSASTVVEPLDVGDDVSASMCLGGVQVPVGALVFEHREERFRHTVVPTPAGTAHGDRMPRPATKALKSVEV